MNKGDSGTKAKKQVFCFFDYFYPAFKSGGPARSSIGLVTSLRDHLDLFVVTRDRDKEDEDAFQGLNSNKWNAVKGIQVLYLSPGNPIAGLLGQFRHQQPDYYYINSFFSFRFSILPILLIKLGLMPSATIVLAPRGEFSPEALSLGKTKKKIYKWFFKSFLRFKIQFHATSNHEETHIKQNLGNVEVTFAPNLRDFTEFEDLTYTAPRKTSGRLRMVFVSRITTMKNLRFVVKVLNQCQPGCTLDLYGPIDDQIYWDEIQTSIADLELQNTIRYRGVLDQKQVLTTIQDYDLLFLPTLGENFGHIILESFFAGRPVLISDRTPWRHLQRHQIGWDLSLDRITQFVDCIDNLVSLDLQAYQKLTENAFSFAQNYRRESSHVQAYLALFS